MPHILPLNEFYFTFLLLALFSFERNKKKSLQLLSTRDFYYLFLPFSFVFKTRKNMNLVAPTGLEPVTKRL